MTGRCLLLYLCFFFLSLPAWAFFPKQDAFVKGYNKNYGSLSSWQLEITFSSPLTVTDLVQQEGRDVSVQKDSAQARLLIRIWGQVPADRSLSFSGLGADQFWRQEWIVSQAGEKQLVAAALGKGRFLLAAGAGCSSFPLPLTWFALQPDLVKWSTQLGLALEPRGYTFINGYPALCLGSKDQSGPALCLENEEFFPLRLCFPGQPRYGLYQGFDIEWKEYLHLGNFPLPQAGSLTFASGPELDFNITWGAINTPINKGLFSKEAFASRFHSLAFPAEIPLVKSLLLSLPQAYFQQ